MSKRRAVCLLIAACGIHASAVIIVAADKPTSHFFDANGVKIHYLTAGKGEPLILIHGLHSSAEIVRWVKANTVA